MSTEKEIRRLLNEIKTAGPYESARKAELIRELWPQMRGERRTTIEKRQDTRFQGAKPDRDSL